MALLTILFCIILLVLLVSWAKVNPFLAFIIVSVIAGLLLGIPVDKITASVQTGLGKTLGDITIIIILGAMVGKLVAISSAYGASCAGNWPTKASSLCRRAR